MITHCTANTSRQFTEIAQVRLWLVCPGLRYIIRTTASLILEPHVRVQHVNLQVLVQVSRFSQERLEQDYELFICYQPFQTVYCTTVLY